MYIPPYCLTRNVSRRAGKKRLKQQTKDVMTRTQKKKKVSRRKYTCLQHVGKKAKQKTKKKTKYSKRRPLRTFVLKKKEWDKQQVMD